MDAVVDDTIVQEMTGSNQSGTLQTAYDRSRHELLVKKLAWSQYNAAYGLYHAQKLVENEKKEAWEAAIEALGPVKQERAAIRLKRKSTRKAFLDARNAMAGAGNETATLNAKFKAAEEECDDAAEASNRSGLRIDVLKEKAVANAASRTDLKNQIAKTSVVDVAGGGAAADKATALLQTVTETHGTPNMLRKLKRTDEKAAKLQSRILAEKTEQTRAAGRMKYTTTLLLSLALQCKQLALQMATSAKTIFELGLAMAQADRERQEFYDFLKDTMREYKVVDDAKAHRTALRARARTLLEVRSHPRWVMLYPGACASCSISRALRSLPREASVQPTQSTPAI